METLKPVVTNCSLSYVRAISIICVCLFRDVRLWIYYLLFIPTNVHIVAIITKYVTIAIYLERIVDCRYSKIRACHHTDIETVQDMCHIPDQDWCTLDHNPMWHCCQYWPDIRPQNHCLAPSLVGILNYTVSHSWTCNLMKMI